MKKRTLSYEQYSKMENTRLKTFFFGINYIDNGLIGCMFIHILIRI